MIRCCILVYSIYFVLYSEYCYMPRYPVASYRVGRLVPYLPYGMFGHQIHRKEILSDQWIFSLDVNTNFCCCRRSGYNFVLVLFLVLLCVHDNNERTNEK